MKHKSLTILLPFILLCIVSAGICKSLDGSFEPVSALKDTRNTVDLPILMYHGLTDEKSRQNTYFITESQFIEDLKYLRDKGYTTITTKDMLDFVNKGKPLPQKPVLLTFDDGYANNYLFAFPHLKENNMKALISIIGKPIEEDSLAQYRQEDYCSLSYHELKEMTSSGVFELGNHTYDLHHSSGAAAGALALPGEEDFVYQSRLYEDLNACQNLMKENFSTCSKVFTWPFGAKEVLGEDVIKKIGFKITLSCTEGINHLSKGDPECLMNMKRNLRSPMRDIATLLAP